MTIRDLNFNNMHRWMLYAFTAITPIFYYTGKSFGVQTLRVSQEQCFQLGITILVAFLINNIYLSLFMLWSAFLYIFFNFQGGNYMMNIMFACLLFHITTQFLQRKDVETIFKIFLGIVFLNFGWAILQQLGHEPFFKRFSDGMISTDPVGFMGIKMALGMIAALAVPIALKYNLFMALSLFYPIYISQSSACIVAGFIGLLWWVYHKSMKFFVILVLIASIASGVYIYHDSKANMFKDRFNIWKVSMSDIMTHPITGWGLDSFRNNTSVKNFMYFTKPSGTEAIKAKHIKDTNSYILPARFISENGDVNPWDNPHNLIISIMFEFGIFGILLLVGLILDIKRRFNACFPEQIAVTGFFIVLLILSIGHFPLFLARTAYIVPVMLGIYYIITTERNTQ